MKVIKFNLSKAGRKYQNNQGVEKTQWDWVGTFTEFHKDDGTVNKVVEIPSIGLVANVFAIKPKEGQKVEKTEATVQLETEFPDEDIDPSSIPF